MKFVVAINSQKLTGSLLNYSERLIQRLRETLDRLSIAMQASIKGSKLSGQVLNVRTGTLRRSINREVRYAGQGLIEAVVGTNVEYAAIHEFGFTGTEQVKAHLRMMRIAWGRPVKNPRKIDVREHARKVNLPERSFLRSTLKEFETRARVAIELTAVRALTP